MPSHPFESGSPLRHILREASTVPYRPVSSLAEAQSHADGYVVLEGDDGGMIYVVAPARTVKVEEGTLDLLLKDLDEMVWGDAQPDMRRVYFEKRKHGIVPGGTGGGQASGPIWVHSEFRQKGLESAIAAVLEGRKARVTDKNA